MQSQKTNSIFLLISLLTLLLASGALVKSCFFSPKIAYINTGKLMIGFSEANKIEREIKTEDDKWQVEYKTLQDSLQATIRGMSKEYNSATPAKKKEFQDMLSARNQQVNNFKQANIRKMEELKLA